ncbi:MAG TPA: OmpA family protein [Gemmatimonadaceae bacterium]|jgi:outer membrane protein OmpA-like peptidoglycan-associated protein
MRHITRVLALVCAALVGASAPAAAQGILSKLGSKAKQRVDATANQAMDSALSRAANAVVCAITDNACMAKAKATGKPIKVTDASGKPVSSADSAAAISAAVAQAAQAAQPALDSAGNNDAASPAGPPANTVLVNYDFVPGDRVIYAEDFSSDNIGDFPKRMELVQGNFEVAKWNGAPFLRATTPGRVMIPLPEVLPPQFTFEMDFTCGSGWDGGIEFADPDHEPAGVSTIQMSPGSGGVAGPIKSQMSLPVDAVRPVTHVAVMVDNLYVKAYLNGVRVANVPKATLGRTKGIWLTVTASAESPAYIGNIRVAEGGKPLYDALAASGHVATHGILFDVGSNRIRPESAPTLKTISDMLTAHQELKLTIEGHTDNVGSAPSNLTLSEQRAAAVKAYLVTTDHIDAARLATKGFGSTKPVAPNTTPEGRQDNRRVELVKM